MAQHNYQKKIDRMMREGKVPIVKGTVSECRIAHDSWCGLHKGGRCNCDPEITFLPPLRPVN